MSVPAPSPFLWSPLGANTRKSTSAHAVARYQWHSFAGGDSIAIPAGSKHKKGSVDFIQWSLSEEVRGC